MPRTSIINDQKKAALLAAIKEGMPVSYACDLIGIPRQTIYDWIKRHESFRYEINIAKAVAIKGLIGEVKEQKGSWKLLKNLGKEEFKEHVEVEYTNPMPVVINEDLDEL